MTARKLKQYNKTGNKVELCDGLFAFGNLYVALQIKERSVSNGKSNEDWLRDVVYQEAVDQVVETVSAIKNNNISVNDCVVLALASIVELYNPALLGLSRLPARSVLLPTKAGRGRHRRPAPLGEPTDIFAASLKVS